MTARRIDPSKVIKNAIPASGLLLMLALTTPVVASQNSLSDCPQLKVPLVRLAAASIGEYRDSSVPDSAALGTQAALTARTVPPESMPKGHLPRRSLFDTATDPVQETDPGDAPNATTQQVESTDNFPEIQARIPGVSSVELQRFKRQMYRRDI